MAAAILVACLFGLAVFAVNTFALDLAAAGWHQIQLIQGTFEPSKDARQLYAQQHAARAVDSSGSRLPDVSAGGKLPRVDVRIAGQAAQERQLRAPDTFRQSQTP